MNIKAAAVCVSDRSSRGEREDLSGPLIVELLGSIAEETSYCCIPDEQRVIEEKLIELCQSADVIFTTGGTGLAPRDVTPQATQAVAEYTVPGIAEAMRLRSFEKTQNAMLSRAVCAVREKTLIINLPGSPKAVRECLEVVLPILRHAVDLLRGEVDSCAR